MSNARDKYIICMMYCKVINTMESRKNKGRRTGSGGGRRFVVFSRVLRRVCACVCRAVWGGEMC